MASYFDHFILINIINPYITDSLIIMLGVIVLWTLMNYSKKIIPSRFQSSIEIIIEHWALLIEENLGEKSKFYILPLFSLFIFILTINLFGFFLYTFPVTTHISITFGAAFSIWLSILILGFYKFRTSFFSIFMPLGAPLNLSPLLVLIEVASNLSKPVALGMRLAANLTAGHILLAILANFSMKLLFFSSSLTNLFPIFIIIFMVGLEVGVLVIQAYVFCMLTMIYIKDSLILH